MKRHKGNYRIDVKTFGHIKKRCRICKEWAVFENYKDLKGVCSTCRSKRTITLFEEQVIRACHHDFDCLTLKEAADTLDVPIAEINEALDTVKRVAKRLRVALFPILTILEADCCELFINDYMTHSDIAEYLSSFEDCGRVTTNAVSKAIMRAKDKGFHVPPKRFRNPDGPKMLRFDEKWMSSFVVMRF